MSAQHDLIIVGGGIAGLTAAVRAIELGIQPLVLEKENILCLPGSFFGPNQEQFLRIAFANATVEELSVLSKRLESSLRSLAPA